MKVAVIHDWLTGMRGGEKVLEAILEIFPEADLYTMVYREDKVSDIIKNRKVYTSFINKLPFADKLYKHYNPLFPFAVEQFDLNDYDLVISSSHQAAKGVLTGPETVHISYIHTPVRYYWDQYHEYFKTWNPFIKIIIGSVATFYRTWDVVNTNRVDYLIANSKFVEKRIKKYYGREAKVIYPPVDTKRFENIYQKDEEHYLIVSALVPYKRIDITIKAFNENGRKLVIIGKGEELEKLKEIAKPNIEFLGRVSDEKLEEVYQHTKGFIINSIEDFGIAPIEAQAAGVPVIAFAKGGALETVIDGETGVFYDKQTPSSLNEAIERFEDIAWNKEKIKMNSKRFSKEKFIEELANTINQVLGYAKTEENGKTNEHRPVKRIQVKDKTLQKN